MSVSQPPPANVAPRERTPVGGTAVSTTGIVILAALLMSMALLALYGLWRFWPTPAPATGPAPVSAAFTYFSWHLVLTRDQQFFVVVALAGVMGAILHGMRSLSTFVGERYLFRSWILYYVLLPIVGALLATIIYVVLRAGLLPTATNVNEPDPYGVVAIAALTGMFSAQAAEKLKSVFETLFQKAETRSESTGDAAPSSVQAPSGAQRAVTETGMTTAGTTTAGTTTAGTTTAGATIGATAGAAGAAGSTGGRTTGSDTADPGQQGPGQSGSS